MFSCENLIASVFAVIISYNITNHIVDDTPSAQNTYNRYHILGIYTKDNQSY